MNLRVKSIINCQQSALQMHCSAYEMTLWTLAHRPFFTQTAFHSREIFALACGMEAVSCQAADNCCCDHHRLQHNLRRIH